MIAPAKTKSATAFPRLKIERAVGAVIPSGKAFKVHVADSGIGKSKIVRIVTPAWKNQRPYQRIERILVAMDGKLTGPERKQILRFSVLTPQEFEKL